MSGVLDLTDEAVAVADELWPIVLAANAVANRIREYGFAFSKDAILEAAVQIHCAKKFEGVLEDAPPK